MSAIVRNNFSLPTLLLAGACIQSLITLVFPFRYAILPVFAFLAGQIVYTAITSLGYVNNPYMRHVRGGKFTAQIPNADGTISQKASDKNVVVFLIGATSHRCLTFLHSPASVLKASSAQGIFDPGFRQLGDSFRNMFVQIEADPAKWGC